MARITRKLLTRYLKIDAQRRKYNRLAADLDKEQSEIGQALREHVRQHGGKNKSATTCGHVLSLIDVPGNVKWKQEFIRVKSQAAAEKLIEKAPPRQQLTVEPL